MCVGLPALKSASMDYASVLKDSYLLARVCVERSKVDGGGALEVRYWYLTEVIRVVSSAFLAVWPMQDYNHSCCLLCLVVVVSYMGCYMWPHPPEAMSVVGDKCGIVKCV